MEEMAAVASSEENNSILDDEIETLKSIYINETDVLKDDSTTTISIDLHPATADNVHEQYVKMTLKLSVQSEYPEVIPEIEIRNPRGLSDEKLASITEDLIKVAKSKKGNSMLFEIIEVAKDHLTAGNRPCEECAICLCGFHEDDIFTRTECYHYFHSHCLSQYSRTFIKNAPESNSDEDATANELLCPVCRLPIHFEGSDTSFPPPVKSGEEFTITDAVLESQKKMHELYKKQVEKGGIIDIEAEKNKYLLEISHVPSVADVAPGAILDNESIEESSEEKDVDSLTPSIKNAEQSSPEELVSEKSKNKKFLGDDQEDARKHNRRDGFVRNNQHERYRKNYEKYQDGQRHDNYNRNQNEMSETQRKNYRYQKFDTNNDENNVRSDKYNASARYVRNDGNQRNARFNSDRSQRYNGDRRNNYYDGERRYFRNGDRRSDQYDGDRKYDRYDSERKIDRYGGGRRNDRYGDERRNDRYGDERRNDRYGDERRNDRLGDGRKNFGFDREQRNRQPSNDKPNEGKEFEDNEDDNCETKPNDNVQSEADNDVRYKPKSFGDERRNDRYGDGRRNNRFDREQRNRQPSNDKPNGGKELEDNCETKSNDNMQSEADNVRYKPKSYGNERRNDRYGDGRRNNRFDREQRNRQPSNDKPNGGKELEENEGDNWETKPYDNMQSEADSDVRYKPKSYGDERRNERYGDGRRNNRFDREQRNHKPLNDKPNGGRELEDNEEDNCEPKPNDSMQSETDNDGGYKTKSYVNERRNDRYKDGRRNDRYGDGRRNDRYGDGRRNDRYGDERRNNHFDREQRNRKPSNDKPNGGREFEDNEEDNSETKHNDNMQSETDNDIGYKTKSFNDYRKNERYGDNRRNGRYNSDRRNARYNYDKRNEKSYSDRGNFNYSEHYNHANKNTNFNRAQRNESFKRNNKDNKESKYIKENEVDDEYLESEEKGKEQFSKSPDLVIHDSENLPDKIEDTGLPQERVSDIENWVTSASKTDSSFKDRRNYSSGYKSNFSERTNDYEKRNERNYKKQNSRYNSNYTSESQANASLKRSDYQTQSESLEKENSNSNITDQPASKQWADESAYEENAENECYIKDDPKNSRRSNMSYKERERTNYSKNIREDRYHNRNQNYRESQPYRNNARVQNNQNGFSSYSNRRYNTEKHVSSQNSSNDQTETNVNTKNEANSNQVDGTPAESPPSKSSDLNPSKTSNVDNPVPTSNFLPPMSSVAPPPGFQNPTRKIVYGLAAANPPPGFQRS